MEAFCFGGLKKIRLVSDEIREDKTLEDSVYALRSFIDVETSQLFIYI